MFNCYPSININITAVRDNYLAIKDYVSNNTVVSAVVKANAYGLNAKIISDSLYDAGCRDFWVAYLKEAIDIRTVLPNDANIYVLQGFDKDDIDLLKQYRLTQVINSIEEFNIAKGNGLDLVLFFDTGLSRLGIRPDDVDLLLPDLKDEKISYAMSHLACAEDIYSPYNLKQKQVFEEILSKIMDIKKVKASLSASGGTFLGPEYQYDMVRIGAFLYGIQPSPSVLQAKNVVSVKTQVLQRYSIQPGDGVGYGFTFKANRNTKVAIVSIGYSDGIHRKLSNIGKVLFYSNTGECYKSQILGNISMDLLACDVTTIPDECTCVGHEAVLLDDNYTINDMAAELGTVTCEVLTSLNYNSMRVHITYNT
ncbi:MAG: alanine racemase [Alphaproteobacteria bacterium]|nr:alanine racemase [Alphaproteobacteria bacterium]